MPSRPSIRPLSDDVRFETVRRRSTTEPPVKRDASVAVRPATPSTTRFHPFKNRFRSFLQSSLPRITSVTTLPAFSGPKRPAKQPTSFTFGLSSVHQFDRRIQTSHTSIARSHIATTHLFQIFASFQSNQTYPTILWHFSAFTHTDLKLSITILPFHRRAPCHPHALTSTSAII